ncbi:hypothetical protein ABZS77_06720 [Micromonospora sp. NPDC005298]|uniref:hypothetical protein n=1 Tax=Micromonospora sp. NPDC005298 TaxID=3156873 RepID=UPI0033A10E80
MERGTGTVTLRLVSSRDRTGTIALGGPAVVSTVARPGPARSPAPGSPPGPARR